jgi:hypothetical protein
VSPTEEIREGEPFVAVAVSTRITHPLPDDCVELPYHPAGQAKTGLRRRSVAVCTWLERLTHAHIIQKIGHVPDEKMLVILSKVKSQAGQAGE